MKNTKIYLILLAILGLFIAGCAEKKDPVSGGGTHPEGWMDNASENFHGAAVLWSVNKSNSCKTCHGEDYKGGTSGISCYSCHPGYPHGDSFSHTAIMPDIFWNIRVSCTSCHGVDYAGGDSYGIPDSLLSKNCNRCHDQAQGPETCNTCHGSGSNFAPPVDRSGNNGIANISVGLHQRHLNDTSLTYIAFNNDCMSCHPDVTGFDTPTHLDDAVNDPADIAFPTFSAYENSNPEWDRSTQKCNNVYCHGGFTFRKAESSNDFMYADSIMVGVGTAPLWTDTEADTTGLIDNCALCHGQPPTGHNSAGGCSCHSNWQGGNIVDKTTHIDGKITYGF